MISQELLDRVMAKVPDYQTFMTVDEMDESSRKLAETYPDVVELFEAGRSRGGHPIYCLKIGNGSENAICYGTPHPNEPIGSMLLEAFSQILAEDAQVRATRVEITRAVNRVLANAFPLICMRTMEKI
jgi:hypothetical protein